MIRFAHPEAFLLAALVVLVLRRRFVSTAPATVLRALVVLLLAAVLAEPSAATTERGRDLVVVVDRSRSVPAAAGASVEEVLDRAAKEARAGDRVGVVLFGRDAALESAPQEGFRRAPLSKAVDADGTDLAGAVDRALAALPPGRPGSILVVSDGETTGGDVDAAARHAARRGVRVDVVPLRRAGTFDVAVEDVTAPQEVAPGEAFQVAAWVRSDRPVSATVRLLRDGKPVAEGRRTFGQGTERVLFRDVALEPGIHEIAVEVTGAADRVPENDRATSVLRVGGPFRVLCVTPEGREDRLTRSLAASGIEAVVTAGPTAPLSLDALEGFRALAIEDVPASDLPSGAMETVRAWVEDRGGGLLMTGGGASFGPGGYHKSPIEDVLPVTMEMRQEQRKFALAMALVLDRSGSMALPAPGGPTKMDLANRGVCEAVRMLSPLDEVAVVAVDSEPHVVVPLTRVTDRGAISRRVLSIESMGGGIFVATGLHAGAAQLTKSAQGVRDLVLFADAADAEEPGDYATFVPALRKAGVTVSVIGLGTERDSDAEFLKDVAKRGGGRIFFAANAGDLPRVFAQETIQVARSAMVEEPCAVATLSDLASVGALSRVAFPNVGGYAIAYAKPRALVGLRTKDEMKAPLLSFHQRGLGRSAAFLGVADGKLSGGLASWDGYADFFSTLARWVAGTEAADEVSVTTFRRGHEGRIVVEVPRGREDLLARAEARVSGPNGDSASVDLLRTGATRLEGRFPLAATGSFRPAVGLGEGRFVRGAPLALPYSPEFEPRLDPAEGETLLRHLSDVTGGRIDPPTGSLFDGPRESRTSHSLAAPLTLAALFAFLLEILVRRTSWTPRLSPLPRILAPVAALARAIRRRRPVPAAAPAAARDAAPDGAAIAGSLSSPPAPERDVTPARALGVPPPPPRPPNAPPSPTAGISAVLDKLKRPRKPGG